MDEFEFVEYRRYFEVPDVTITPVRAGAGLFAEVVPHRPATPLPAEA
jgi:hypothetical protein